MENASKAILIAGAVLLVIAIIGVGMGIFITARDSIEDMDNQIGTLAITAHNNEFSLYEGTVSGSQVLECIQKAMSNNSNTEIDVEFKNMVVKIDNVIVVEQGITQFKTPSNFKANGKYKANFIYDTNGLIKTIEFSK